MEEVSSRPEQKEVPVANGGEFILRNLTPSKCFLRVPDTRLSLGLSNSSQSQLSQLSFNHDHNPYTPAFVEFSSKDFYSQNPPQSTTSKPKNRHSSRPKTQPNSRSDMLLLAEPSSKFCSVCHQKFQNYFKHINHPYHVKQLEQAQGTVFIGDLVKEVQRRRKNEEVMFGYFCYEIDLRATPKRPFRRIVRRDLQYAIKYRHLNCFNTEVACFVYPNKPKKSQQTSQIFKLTWVLSFLL